MGESHFLLRYGRTILPATLWVYHSACNVMGVSYIIVHNNLGALCCLQHYGCVILSTTLLVCHIVCIIMGVSYCSQFYLYHIVHSIKMGALYCLQCYEGYYL